MAHPDTADHKRRGKLLHDHLHAVARVLIGVDLDVTTNRELLPADSATHWLWQANVETGGTLQTAAVSPAGDVVVPEVIVAAEILEHLTSPGLALSNLRRCFGVARLVVTVPNAFASIRLPKLRRGIEEVNPDHVAWYSPQTLTALLDRHGWTVRRLFAYRGKGLQAPGIVAEAT